MRFFDTNILLYAATDQDARKGDLARELIARAITVNHKTDVTLDLVRHAMDVKEEYGIQFYDALIVSTAEKLGCTEIVSEDLNPGQTYRGMAVVNPF